MMNAVEFFKELNRMCDEQRNCKRCPMNKALGLDEYDSCIGYTGEKPEIAVRVVEKWSREHPRKTNLDKIREMFPEMIAVSSMGENDSVEMLIFYKDYLDREYKEKK